MKVYRNLTGWIFHANAGKCSLLGRYQSPWKSPQQQSKKTLLALTKHLLLTFSPGAIDNGGVMSVLEYLGHLGNLGKTGLLAKYNKRCSYKHLFW